MTFDEGFDRMYDVINSAVRLARTIEAATVFEFWKTLYDRQRG